MTIQNVTAAILCSSHSLCEQFYLCPFHRPWITNRKSPLCGALRYIIPKVDQTSLPCSWGPPSSGIYNITTAHEYLEKYQPLRYRRYDGAMTLELMGQKKVIFLEYKAIKKFKGETQHSEFLIKIVAIISVNRVIKTSVFT